MRRLVTIDLTAADLAAFEVYEATALPLLARHGGRLEARVRALDGSSETHLLCFPDAHAFEAYRSDPVRLSMQDQWAACGAIAVVTEVEAVG